MIWDLIYICYLATPTDSELHTALLYVIENGSIEQVQEVYNKYCVEP